MSPTEERAARRRMLRKIFAAMRRTADGAVGRFAPGGRVPARSGGTGHGQGAEPPLGNPDADGDVLSSTTAGVRSWVAHAPFDPARLHLLTNGDPADPQLIFAGADVIVIYA